jgi:hypothetical protein
LAEVLKTNICFAVAKAYSHLKIQGKFGDTKTIEKRSWRQPSAQSANIGKRIEEEEGG